MESLERSGVATADDSVEDQLQDGYLSELLSYSLDRLNKEPELLKADSDRVRRQMQEVAVGHYRAFITAAEAVKTIRKEVSTIDGHLQSLISEVPELTKGCSTFLGEAHRILERRSRNKALISNHPALVDLLEIPQLMDTCVRNGNYDEALDLEAFVAKLATLHSKLPAVQMLATEVAAITESMLVQLLNRLKANIQLPECLRVVAFLRRLSAFSETEMRLQFLRCRDSFLSSLLTPQALNPALSPDPNPLASPLGPYDHLKRLTDLYRVQLFDIITQYRAVFLDSLEASNGGPPPGRAAEWGDPGGVILYSWANHRLGKYVGELERLLPAVRDGGALAGIMDHAMYCGMSLGRVGLDFRGLLPPLFEACIRQLFVSNVELALQGFQHVLDTHRWVPLPSLGGARSSSHRPDDLAPPYSLMEHPPLATLVNGVLAALNHLRPCAPAPLLPPLALHLHSVLLSVSDSLLRFHETRVGRAPHAGLFLQLCKAYIEVACPYLALCFTRCFSPAGPLSGSLLEVRSVAEPVRKLLIANLAVTDEAEAKGAEKEETPPAEAEPRAGNGAEEGKAEVGGKEGDKKDDMEDHVGHTKEEVSLVSVGGEATRGAKV